MAAARVLVGATLLSLFAPAQGEQIHSDVVMRGTRYETRYYIKKGDAPGPVVVVIGGLHGDETAGYLAARKLAKWKITRGTLVVMPDAHREAIRRNMRGYPGNMNNMFPGKANGNDMERLAHEIWQVIKNAKPDLLITLHESRDFHARNPSRYGQTFCFDFEELVPSMTRVLRRVNTDISPRLHKFLIFVDPFPRCPTYNAWLKLKVPATSIETSRTLPLSTRVRYQLMATQAFFDDVGLSYDQRDLPRLSTALQPPANQSGTAANDSDAKPIQKPTSVSPPSKTNSQPKSLPAMPSVSVESPTTNASKSEHSKQSNSSSYVLLGVFALSGVGALIGLAGWRLSLGRARRQ